MDTSSRFTAKCAKDSTRFTAKDTKGAKLAKGTASGIQRKGREELIRADRMETMTAIKALILDCGEVLVRPQSAESIRVMAQ